MRDKPKFDKRKCLKCKYHGVNGSGYPVRVKDKVTHIYCDFASITGITCLKPESSYSAIDLRGEDYSNCKLFIEGEVEREVTQLIIGSNRYEGRG